MNNLTSVKNYTPVDYENLNIKFENNRVYNLATNKDYAGKNKERLIEFCKENKFKYTIFLIKTPVNTIAVPIGNKTAA